MEISGLQWYALHVRPQKEFAVQRRLEEIGVQTFLPCTVVWRGVNKFTRVKVRRAYPLMVRWLFAAFDRDPLWYHILTLPHVSGVAGMAGVPAMINPAEIERLAREYMDGMFNAPLEHRWMKTKAEFSAGDLALITDGPMSQHVVKVEEITGKRAKVLLELFGTQKVVEIDVSRLELADGSRSSA